MDLITARGLQVHKRSRNILDDAHCTIRAGEVLGLVGPNGAGKTTLLRALIGIQSLSAGDVHVKSLPLAQWRRRDLAQVIGYLPQQAMFYWPLSVSEAVGFGRFPHRASQAQSSSSDDAAIEREMSRLEITALKARMVHELSGGERMRVHLARLLCGDHEVFVADEPITSLDPKFQLDVLTRLRQSARAGAGVVISIHDLGLAVRFCDRLLVLDRGRIVADDFVERALSDEILHTVFHVAGTYTTIKGERSLIVTASK